MASAMRMPRNLPSSLTQTKVEWRDCANGKRIFVFGTAEEGDALKNEKEHMIFCL